jgi:hypothetical protein
MDHSPCIVQPLEKIERLLKELGIKKTQIKERCEADGKVLVCLHTAKNVAPHHLASEEEIKAICTVERYIREYSRLIELERDAEMQQQLQEIRTLSGKER